MTTKKTKQNITKQRCDNTRKSDDTGQGNDKKSEVNTSLVVITRGKDCEKVRVDLLLCFK